MKTAATAERTREQRGPERPGASEGGSASGARDVRLVSRRRGPRSWELRLETGRVIECGPVKDA